MAYKTIYRLYTENKNKRDILRLIAKRFESFALRSDSPRQVVETRSRPTACRVTLRPLRGSEDQLVHHRAELPMPSSASFAPVTWLKLVCAGTVLGSKVKTAHRG